MPWKDLSTMQQRLRFLEDWQDQIASLSELCRRAGISRKTAYKWLERYAQEGPAGLDDRSRARKTQPHATPREQEDLILELRANHPRYGPKKIKAVLARQHPGLRLPAKSTIGAILVRHGLSVARKRLRHTTPSPNPLSPPDGPNSVWCVDFKGWFYTADGTRIDPLTITDAASRFLLCCQAVAKTDGAHVRALFEAVFRQYGLPAVIRSDNGPPFASTGLAGLSRLSVWWMRLGITPERIAPGKPQQNGAHERMHLTLLQEVASPPEATLSAQQRAFVGFRRHFNEQRPHEALGQRPPAELYTPSPRPFPARLAEVEYEDDWVVRKVRGSGQIKWGGAEVRVTEALLGEPVGLEAVEDGLWRVYYCQTALGWFDERRLRITAQRPGVRRA